VKPSTTGRRVAQTWFLLAIAATLTIVPSLTAAEIRGDGFVDFEAGQSGDVASAMLLKAATHGNVGAWSIVGDGTKLSISFAAAHPVDGSVTVSGSSYDARSTRGMKSSWAANNHAQLDLPKRYTNLSVGFHFQLSQLGGTHDLFNLEDGTRGVYNVLQVSGQHVHLHSNASDPHNTSGWSKAGIALLPNHWYWVTMKFAGGCNVAGAYLDKDQQWTGAPSISEMNVYDAADNYRLFGRNTYLMGSTGSYSDYAVSRIWIGALKYSANPKDWSYYDNLVVCFDGLFPVGPPGVALKRR
jgi:hypothetical protein